MFPKYWNILYIWSILSSSALSSLSDMVFPHDFGFSVTWVSLRLTFCAIYLANSATVQEICISKRHNQHIPDVCWPSSFILILFYSFLASSTINSIAESTRIADNNSERPFSFSTQLFTMNLFDDTVASVPHLVYRWTVSVNLTYFTRMPIMS